MPARSKLPLLLLLSLISLPALSQSDSARSSLSVTAGIGNYEAVHAGLRLQSKKHHHYFEAGAGLKPWGFAELSYRALYLCAGASFFPGASDKKIIPGIQLRTILWDLDNLHNRFVVFAVGPEARVSFRINHKLLLALNGGIVYNSPLIYERKTYYEVGWPKEWLPSFSLQVVHPLK